MSSLSRCRVAGGRLSHILTPKHNHPRPVAANNSISMTRQLHSSTLLTPRPRTLPSKTTSTKATITTTSTRYLAHKPTRRPYLDDIDLQAIYRLGANSPPPSSTTQTPQPSSSSSTASTSHAPTRSTVSPDDSYYGGLDPDEIIYNNEYRVLRNAFLGIVLFIYATTWIDPLLQASRGLTFIFNKPSSSTAPTDPTSNAETEESIQEKEKRKQMEKEAIRHDMDEYNAILERTNNALWDYQSIKEASSRYNTPTTTTTATQTIQISPLPPSAPISHFLKRHFAYCPADLYPVPGSDGYKPHTHILYMFTHMSLPHVIFNFIALRVFVLPIVPLYGKNRVAAMFLLGGGMAAVLHSTVERFVNPAARLTRDMIWERVVAREGKGEGEVSKEEKETLKRYFTKGIGASSAIWALGTITAFAAPHVSVELFFLPFSIRLPRAIMGLIAFDAAGLWVFDGYGFSLGHAGHLAGYAAGAVMWMVWVRRIPPPAWYAEALSRWQRLRVRGDV